MPTETEQAIIMQIVLKLAQLGHEVTWQEPITTGPLITTFRFAPRNATKVAQITSCAQDLALALKVEDVVVRRLPGEGVIGVSVPKAERTMVLWRDTLAKPDASAAIPLNFGVDSQGRQFRDDLAMMPHLLIAGSTFGGKTVLLNSIIASLMYWRTPEQVRFVLSDTKSGGGLEFNHYKGAPHLLQDPVNTKYQTWEAMDWLIDQTDVRLREIARAGCQNIQQYKELTVAMADARTYHGLQAMPYWVLIIDELADIVEGDKRGESKIANSKLGKIVQKARAAGIHVIAATQRPSVDVVAGVVKNNFTGRLSFKLSTDTDSRTVFGQSGAEHLLSKGDMFYSGPAAAGLKRLHSAYASLDDIKQMTSVMRMQYAH